LGAVKAIFYRPSGPKGLSKSNYVEVYKNILMTWNLPIEENESDIIIEIIFLFLQVGQKMNKSLFGIVVENIAFGYRAFICELLSKVLLLKSYYMFGNCMS
jgi:hypothetical protein